MENVRWPAEQLEEHRLEISNRIRNLFWTVSGDYDIEFEPDTEKYVYSKQTVLYEAVKQGAFARYFDQKKLGMYLMKKLHFSAKPASNSTSICFASFVTIGTRYVFATYSCSSS